MPAMGVGFFLQLLAEPWVPACSGFKGIFLLVLMVPSSSRQVDQPRMADLNWIERTASTLMPSFLL